MNTIYMQLEKMTIGFTTQVRGQIVTRWSATTFEIGTFGKSVIGIHGAADILGAA